MMSIAGGYENYDSTIRQAVLSLRSKKLECSRDSSAHVATRLLGGR